MIFLPIGQLAYCDTCKGAFDVRDKLCPKCGSDSFWLIAKWLNRPPAKPSERPTDPVVPVVKEGQDYPLSRAD